MKQWVLRLVLIAFFVLAFPFRSPAPLVYRVGEGWTYELPGEELGAWRRLRAEDQLKVAQAAFDKKDFSLARKAADRVVKQWPFSDFAPQAQYLLARCDEQSKRDERAFKEYQKLLEKYPKSANYDEIVKRQFEICNRFLNGERFKLWNWIPTLPSMEKTVKLYESVIKNGPYSDVAAQSQMNIGAAREKQTRLFNDNEPLIQAAKAYEVAADRYHDRPKIASDAMFKAGLAYDKQARTAEYDQSTAGKAIDTFRDFKDYFPDDPRATEGDKMIAELQTEQARGNYEIARFYEHGHHWKSALVYYNEVVIKDPKSPYAAPSLQRIAELKKLTAPPRKMMRDVWRFCACALAAAMLGGCAYRLGPTNGETAGNRSVQVQPFLNKTLEPHLTDYMENSVRKRLQEDGTYKVETHGDGDIILSGVIVAYARVPLSFQPTDVISVVDYEITMTAQVTARERSTGKLIFEKPVVGRATLRVGADQTSAERSAIPILTDDVAKKAVALLVDGSL